jgi:hypothetical protein
MDPNTTKDTMGCRVAAKSSGWFAGGSRGVGSLDKANVEIKTAPTPIYAKFEKCERE